MNEKNNGPMPKGYEHLNAPLHRSQEHVFLINTEIERLDGNPINEGRLENLQQEKSKIVEGLKLDFEKQTWEAGPAFTEQIENIIDRHIDDDTYRSAKSSLLESGKTYEKSNYWQDKLERNLADWQKQYDLSKNEKDVEPPDYSDRFEVLDIE